MPRLDRCCEAGRRARQHYRGPARSFCLAFLVFFLSLPGSGQSLIRIQVLEGEGVINGAGARSTRPIVAQLTDETGRPLEGVAVSFRLPEEGPGGVFESGMKTEVVISTADGRAAVHGMRWNRTAGPFQMRITAVKGESRAGTICSQYISDAPVKSPGVARTSKMKWLVLIAAAAGGAAATGVLAGNGAAKTTPVGAGPAPIPTSVGLPTLSVSAP